MYTTRTQYKNQDTFTPSGKSIGIGDPYHKQNKKDSRFGGKQFQVGNRGSDTFGGFQSVHALPSKGGKYQSDPYTKPKKTRDQKQLSQDAGFGSKDGRGIQNDVISTKQYAEKLAQEDRAQRRTLAAVAADIIAPAVVIEDELTLFDRCNAGENEEGMRLRPGKGATKRYGSMKTSAQEFGKNAADAPVDEQRIKNSRVAVTKTFYNSGRVGDTQTGDYLNM